MSCFDNNYYCRCRMPICPCQNPFPRYSYISTIIGGTRGATGPVGPAGPVGPVGPAGTNSIPVIAYSTISTDATVVSQPITILPTDSTVFSATTDTITINVEGLYRITWSGNSDITTNGTVALSVSGTQVEPISTVSSTSTAYSGQYIATLPAGTTIQLTQSDGTTTTNIAFSDASIIIEQYNIN